MKLKFTYHAQYRVDKREISSEMIKEVIKNPESSNIKYDRVEVMKNINGRKLFVIYKRSKLTYIIITSYYEK